MKRQRSGGYSVTVLTVQLVWVTKYCYAVLQGDLQTRSRTLLMQGYDALGIRILQRAVSKDHVHMHVEYSPSLSISEIVKKLKGRSSKLL